jgi:hypothetical protein
VTEVRLPTSKILPTLISGLNISSFFIGELKVPTHLLTHVTLLRENPENEPSFWRNGQQEQIKKKI